MTKDKVKKDDKPEEVLGEQLEQESEVQKEIEELKAKAKEWESKYKRALADYQNLEKRTKEARVEWIKSASKEVILKLLPVLDTLMLAHKHVEDKGLELSIKQFLNILEEEGLKRIKTTGEEFDPSTMEGVGTTEGEENKVVEEVRVGFTLHGSVVRPAQVLVGAQKS